METYGFIELKTNNNIKAKEKGKIMSALNKSTQIPTAISTVEGLAVWACSLLLILNPKIKIVEAENTTVPVVQGSISSAADGTLRYTARISFPISSAYFSNDSKLWENSLEIDTVQIPTTFTTNGA